MKYTFLLVSLPLISGPLFAQTSKEVNKEGYKTSTVSDFLASKYTWEEQKEEGPKVEVVNKTPLKPVKERRSNNDEEIEARLQPTLDIDDPGKHEDIPEDELGLDTVTLREYEVNELYSPLMRMSELKDLETLDPKSGGAYLTEAYFSEFENRYLNRWHIPLIGKSQEQLAKERYQQEQYQNFLGEISGTIEGMEHLNPEQAKELSRELRETKHQYNNNFKNDDLRFSGPDAKF
ncbi:MAG: hypothetical protein KJT03_04575 [Verrucomicrobiae bacterium]|nr:hypothetical protein [Verrucomicrobiae bacterium]